MTAPRTGRRPGSLRSGESGIDVPRIGRLRQRGQPAGDVFAADPIRVDKALAFAECGVEPRVAQRDAARDAGERDLALDDRELERQRLDRARETQQRLLLET